MRQLTLLLAILAPALAAQDIVVIQNAVIHTSAAAGTIQGSLVIRDGKIADVGGTVMTPLGARIIDANGKHVIPGIIDCHTHIGVDSINEGSVSVSSMVGLADVVNPEKIDIYRALAGGVTTANVLHGSANAIGGKCVVLKMRWGQDAAGLIFKEAPPSLKMALGENPKRPGIPIGPQLPGAPQNLRYPGTRLGVEDVIRDAFTRARQYRKEWSDYRAQPGAHPLVPRRDLELETLVEVLEGRRLIQAHCYRADEILMLMRIFDDFNIHGVTYQHALEAYKVASEIAARRDGVSTFSDWWSYKVEAFDAIPYNAAILQKKGVLVSLNSDDVSAELMRRLNSEAGKLIKYGGLTDDEALATITINPARQMRIDRWVGSIETGKQADLVIYDKDPLSMYSKVEKVFIDGHQYFDRDTDLAERARKDAQKKGLLDKQKDTDRKDTPQSRRPS